MGNCQYCQRGVPVKLNFRGITANAAPRLIKQRLSTNPEQHLTFSQRVPVPDPLITPQWRKIRRGGVDRFVGLGFMVHLAIVYLIALSLQGRTSPARLRSQLSGRWSPILHVNNFRRDSFRVTIGKSHASDEKHLCSDVRTSRARHARAPVLPELYENPSKRPVFLWNRIRHPPNVVVMSNALPPSEPERTVRTEVGINSNLR